jgi:hypothetical protein
MKNTSTVLHPSVKHDTLVNGGALKLALMALRRAGKDEIADELEMTAKPVVDELEIKAKDERKDMKDSKPVEPLSALMGALSNACLSSAFNEENYGKPTKQSIEQLREVRNSYGFPSSNERYLCSEVDHYLKEYDNV